MFTKRARKTFHSVEMAISHLPDRPETLAELRKWAGKRMVFSIDRSWSLGRLIESNLIPVFPVKDNEREEIKESSTEGTSPLGLGSPLRRCRWVNLLKKDLWVDK